MDSQWWNQLTSFVHSIVSLASFNVHMKIQLIQECKLKHPDNALLWVYAWLYIKCLNALSVCFTCWYKAALTFFSLSYLTLHSLVKLHCLVIFHRLNEWFLRSVCSIFNSRVMTRLSCASGSQLGECKHSPTEARTQDRGSKLNDLRAMCLYQPKDLYLFFLLATIFWTMTTNIMILHK